MIKFNCPHCGARLRVPDELAGKQGRCAGCQRAIDVPRPPEIQAESASTERISLKVPEHLSANNHYLICNSKDVVATWENDGKGWMVRVKEGFVRAATNPTELPSMGNYVLIEIEIVSEGPHKRLAGVHAFALPGAYCLSRLSRGDDPILDTIQSTAEMNERQIALVRQRINAKFLPSIWDDAQGILELPEI